VNRKRLLKALIIFAFLIIPFFTLIRPVHGFLWLFQRKTGDKYVATGTFSDALFEKMEKEVMSSIKKASSKKWPSTLPVK
jgi:hypothetical protein